MSHDTLESIYPLSPAQKGILFHSLFEGTPGVYVAQIGVTLTGEMDVPAFDKAWHAVVARHPALRTAFRWDDLDKPLQLVLRHTGFAVQQHDLSTLEAGPQHEWQERYLAEERQQGFDLTRAAPFRVALLRLGADVWRLLVSYHHILLDAWSVHLLFNDLFAVYAALREGRRPELSPAPDFRRYISWVERQEGSRSEALWRGYLQGFTAPTPLPGDQEPRGLARGEDPVEEQVRVLSGQAYEALQDLATRHQLGLATVLQGAWGLLLSRASGERDVLFGSTVSGRSVPVDGIESIVGLLINTLPVRVRIESAHSVAGYLRLLREEQLPLREHEHSQLVDIRAWAGLPGNWPLFESIVVFQNQGMGRSAGPSHVPLGLSGFYVSERSNYPLTLVASETPQGLELLLAANGRRFPSLTITRLLNGLVTVLEQMAAQPEQPLWRVSVLPAEERQRVLTEWNATQAPFPSDALVHQLFEHQVDRTPEALAVEQRARRLTYRQLDERANQLAHRLRALGVGPEVVVGLCVSSSFEAIPAMYGVLKAGAAYVPLDASAPRERLAFILRDAGVRVLITEAALLEALPTQGLQVLALDTEAETLATLSTQRPAPTASADNLAYVIYTSGSTGEPKGVAVTHRSVVNHNTAVASRFGLTAADRLLQFTPIHFDAAVEEIYPPLLSGAVVVVQGELIPAEDFSGLITHQRLTVLSMPPAYVHEWLLGLERRGERVPPIRLMLLGGEAILPETLARWRRLGGEHIPWFNVYGPTEATVTSAMDELRSDLPEPVLPIGRPIANAQAYVLNEDLQPVPVGTTGELYLGGAGLARGYLGLPERTAERFIPHPFARQPGERLYRTGDLARQLPDGRLVFAGRADRQVKIRGSRVELGEVEAQLRRLPGVEDAVVVAREDTPGDKWLVAYLVHATQSPPSAATLRARLKESLPGYMMPSAFVALAALPLTPNGKVDFRALPAPEAVAAPERPYVAPRTETQRRMAALWAEVLRLERVGAEDDFFACGGQSLLAMQVVSKVRSAFQVDVPLRQLFERPTLSAFAAAVDEVLRPGRPQGWPPIQRFPRSGTPPRATFGQEQQWFLYQSNPSSQGYLIPLRLQLTGRLDVESFWRAVQELVLRHEVLRTTYANSGESVVQHIHPEMPVAPLFEDLRGLSSAEQEEAVSRRVAQEAAQPIDLSRGPLLRAVMMRLADERHVAVMLLHHITFDGWSARVMAQELGALYEAFSAGRPSPLPALPIQVADYAEWERGVFTPERLSEEVAWWKQNLKGAPELLALPTDHSRPPSPSGRNGRHCFTVPEGLAAELRRMARSEGVTVFSTLLSALGAVLSRYASEEDIVLGAVTANRDLTEVEPLIGFFLGLVPIRLKVDGRQSAREFLKRSHEAALDALEHRHVPFHQIVEALNPERSTAYAPLVQVALQFDNIPEPASQGTASVDVEEQEVGEGASAYDLLVAIIEKPGQGLQVGFNYSRDLFEAATMARLEGHFVMALRGLLESPGVPLTELALLTEEERHALLVRWNSTAAGRPASALVHELFEEQARRTPGALAAIESKPGDGGTGRRLTYGELDSRANQLAHYLRARGIGPEVRVALVMEPSLEAVLSLYAVLKAGGAYVPMDPEVPLERLRFMLRDAGISVLLTQERLAPRLAEVGLPLIAVDGDWQRISQQPAHAPGRMAGPDNAAYVIYTSGSTGEPKGVIVPHRAVVNHNLALAARLQLGPADRMLQFTPLNFDAAGEEIYPPLLSGASIVVRGELIPYDELAPLVEAHRLTVMSLPPAYVHEWLTTLDLRGGRIPAGLRMVLLGGEKIRPETFTLWQVLGGHDVPWVNVYGPSEATITAALCELGDGSLQEGGFPIGRPISNVTAYVLDTRGRLLPVGQKGELYLGGAGLARGYLERPDETAARFVPDPFSRVPGARLYRTGDLARYRPDGQLEVLGRVDHQVKIRGHRIELGEIEAILQASDTVQAAVATVREDLPGGPGLVAYVVPAEGHGGKVQELREVLKQRLPHYMVPSALVPLERLPLTPNGKVDFKALPAPSASARQAGPDEQVAPLGAVEQRLATIWQELLEVPAVGLKDDFFELGGHSLLLMRVLDRIREEFEQEIPVANAFAEPTIEGFSRELHKARPDIFAREAAARRSPLLVPLASGPADKAQLPVFLVHTLGVDITCYSELARRLGQERPVYGIQPPELVSGHPRATTFAELARLYAEALRTVQPYGPYRIGGHSFGAHIAFELAIQLRQLGEEVASLAVLDTLSIPYMRVTFRNTEGQGAQRPTFEGMKRDGHITAEWDEASARQHLNIAVHQLDLTEAWQASPYDGRIAVYACTNTLAMGDASLGWKALTVGKVTVDKVPGEHQSMLSSPHVDKLAKLLAKEFSKAT